VLSFNSRIEQRCPIGTMFSTTAGFRPAGRGFSGGLVALVDRPPSGRPIAGQASVAPSSVAESNPARTGRPGLRARTVPWANRSPPCCHGRVGTLSPCAMAVGGPAGRAPHEEHDLGSSVGRVGDGEEPRRNVDAEAPAVGGLSRHWFVARLSRGTAWFAVHGRDRPLRQRAAARALIRAGHAIKKSVGKLFR
jgi:hypothetical protein